MKYRDFIRIIIPVFLIVIIMVAVLLNGALFEGRVSSNKDYYTFVLEGKIYSLPFKVSDFKENGWEITEDENNPALLGGHACAEFEAVKGGKRVSVLVGNPDLSRATVDKSNIVGIKFYYDSGVNFLLRDNISYDFTKEQIISTFGINDNFKIDDTENIEIFSYFNKEKEYDKAEFYFYSSALKKDKAGFPAVALYNFGELIFDVSGKDTEEREYQEPDKLGEDLSSGLFSLDGKIYSLPMSYEHFKADWKSTGYSISLPSDTYYKKLALYSVNASIGINPYLINESDFVTKADKSTIYGFKTECISDCNLLLPGGLNLSKRQNEMADKLSSFLKYETSYFTTYKYDKGGIKIEIKYSNVSNECEEFTISKNAEEYESNGRELFEYGNNAFFKVNGEVKQNEKIKPMDNICVLSYLPKDFVKVPVIYRNGDFAVIKCYSSKRHGQKHYIYFTQEKKVIDRKINTYKKEVKHENGGIYVCGNELRMFFWTKNGYRFALYTDMGISKEDLYKMADSMVVEEQYSKVVEEKKAAIMAKIGGKTKEEIEAIYVKTYYSSIDHFSGTYQIDGETVFIVFSGDDYKVESIKLVYPDFG